ncbi:MAG: hypothetical protein CEN90_454 [Parcubacteria group bacterium Licking1014_17]|nr:MAG: hypothetical protein CEN90_454 [Parcubacteria group bacterium Licking1014_17]
MIIGITGPGASGKDTAAEHLEKKGFYHCSLSDIIRDYCREKNIETTRENLINAGNELRLKYGRDYLARTALKKIKEQKNKNAVITSLRHPDEVKVLRENPDFTLLMLDAPLEIRYERTQQRKTGRPEDSDSFEQFKKHEEQERIGSGPTQQLDLIFQMADYTVINEGPDGPLLEKVDDFLNKWQKNKKN